MTENVREPIEALLQRLDRVDLASLQLQWRNHLGGKVPTHLPKWLLARLLAYRLQVAAFGGLDKKSQTYLRLGAGRGSAAFSCRQPQSRSGAEFTPGTILVREWRGHLEQVTMLEAAFAWNGKTYGSLSQVARAITGTNWNGHRFFGLRKAAGITAPSTRRMAEGSEESMKATNEPTATRRPRRGSTNREKPSGERAAI